MTDKQLEYLLDRIREEKISGDCAHVASVLGYASPRHVEAVVAGRVNPNLRVILAFIQHLDTRKQQRAFFSMIPGKKTKTRPAKRVAEEQKGGQAA